MPVEQQNVTQRPAWNTGRLIGPKPPLKPRHIWAIRTRLLEVDDALILSEQTDI